MEQPNHQYFVATNLFKPGLELAAVAGLFAPILMNLQDNSVAMNYPGFAGMNFPGLFGNMLLKILSQTCDWVSSYKIYSYYIALTISLSSILYSYCLIRIMLSLFDTMSIVVTLLK